MLLSRVGSSRQEQFRNSHRKLAATGMNVVRDLVRDRQEEEGDSGPRIDIIDSHFHLDLIIQRERLRGFQHLQSIAAPNCSDADLWSMQLCILKLEQIERAH